MLRAWHTRWFGVDGSVYVEAARHVRDGLGLQSQLSLYHAGDDTFPHPTSIYPAWPLLLGLLGRVFDLRDLSHVLPVLLSFVALIVGFNFGRRLWPEPLFPRWLPPFHAGHLIVLMLGMQRDYVWYATVPFTEPLSLILLFGLLWRLLGAPPGPRRAIETGLWAVGVYLCRYQLIIVPIALLLAHGLAVLTGPQRRRAGLDLAINAAVIVGGLGLYYRHLAGFVSHPGLATLLRFDQNRASEWLQPFDVVVESPTLWALLADRATGVVRAWDPTSEASYKHGFYLLHWALPLALPFLAWAGWRLFRDGGRRALWARLQSERTLAWGALLGVAAGGLASVHLAHKHFYGAWYFDERQSIICVLAFFLALGWLLRQPRRAPRWLATGILVISVGQGAQKLYTLATVRDDVTSPDDAYVALVGWLNRKSEDHPIRVIMPGGALQRIGYRTTRVGYHWMDPERTSYADILTMTDKLGAEYVLYLESNAHLWGFREEAAGTWERDFEVLAERPSGFTILRRRAEPPPLLDKPRHVVLIGVDGATGSVIDRLVTRGELPNFRRLKVQGASNNALPTLEIGRVPVFWTTVVTGRWPDGHGVRGYTQTTGTGQMVPVRSGARTAPALWNQVSDAGRPVLLLDWSATWPAEALSGPVLTDHDPVAPVPPTLDELAVEVGLRPEQLAVLAQPPETQPLAWRWFQTTWARDQARVNTTVEALATAAPDLVALHLRGPNTTQRCAWDSFEPQRYATPPAELARDQGMIEARYRLLDRALGEILDAAGTDTLVVVLSDHGVAADEKSKPDRHPCLLTRPTPGVLYLWGGDVRPNTVLTEVDPLDIAPTLAWYLGLPVAADMKGRILSEAFKLDFRAARGRTNVPTWGAREPEPAAPATPEDTVLIEQLRELGYIR